MKISASGRADRFGRNNTLSLQSPEYEILLENNQAIHTGRLIPIYPETQGISSKWLRRQVYNLLTQHLSELSEYMPQTILKKNNLMHYSEHCKKFIFQRIWKLQKKQESA